MQSERKIKFSGTKNWSLVFKFIHQKGTNLISHSLNPNNTLEIQTTTDFLIFHINDLIVLKKNKLEQQEAPNET